MLFDLDGVVTRKDTFTRFVLERVRRRPWLLLPLLPVAAAMLATGSPGRRGAWARRAARVALLALSPDAARASLGDLGADLATRPGWINQDSVIAIRAHVAAGDRVIVVSATEETLARALLARLGLDVELVASTLGTAGCGSRFHSHNHGAAKVRNLQRLVSGPWHELYTDSLADEPLMREVSRVHLVNRTDLSVGRLAEVTMARVDIRSWR